MKKNPKVILLIGLMFLMIGGALHFAVRGAAAATAEQEAACRAQLSEDGGEAAAMAGRCNEAAFAIAMTAQRSGMSAREAGAAIAAANQSETSSSMFNKFMIGFGLALTVIGGIAMMTRKNQP